jgi:hypothetical protein
MLAHYCFDHYDAELAADGNPPSAPAVHLRARNRKMDAIAKWVHGNEAFQVKNAAKALREAMEKAKSHL